MFGAEVIQVSSVVGKQTFEHPFMIMVTVLCDIGHTGALEDYLHHIVKLASIFKKF